MGLDWSVFALETHRIQAAMKLPPAEEGGVSVGWRLALEGRWDISLWLPRR
jgi:hypothetical protein